MARGFLNTNGQNPMQLLNDDLAQRYQGGHKHIQESGDPLGALHKSVGTVINQINIAFNIIIGSGSIANTQINRLSAGFSL
jgi:hypothetical protein